MNEIMSVAANGVQLTRTEIMEHLAAISNRQNTMNELTKKVNRYENEKKLLEAQEKRRSWTPPEKRGFFGKLLGKPDPYVEKTAEEMKQEFDQIEELRVKGIHENLLNIQTESLPLVIKVNSAMKECTKLFEMDYLPKAYRRDPIPMMLLCFMVNGRANTLTEAINLYHQTAHQNRLENLQREQLAELRTTRRLQAQLLEEQRAANEEMNAKLSQVASSARSTELAAWMNTFMTASILDKID